MTDTERILRLKLMFQTFPANSLEVDMWLKISRAVNFDEYNELEEFLRKRGGN